MSEPMKVLARQCVVPVVVLREPASAGPVREALRVGGAECVEVTLRTPRALEAIRTLAEDQGLLVGVGTVTSADQVDQAVEAGARFVVSPGFSLRVVQRCQALGVSVIPGVATATEIQMALDAGVDVVKFFPAAQLGGVAMLRALAAPFASVRFVPTGGIDAGNLAEYLRVPQVVAVGGTWMVRGDLVGAGRWTEITEALREALAMVREVRADGDR